MGTSNIITEEFLRNLFEKEISSFSCEIGTKPGDNYMSTMYSVKVSVIEEDRSCTDQSIFVKCYPEDSAQQEFLDNTPLFPTEYFIYDEFIPLLNILAKEANESSPCGKKSSRIYGINAAKFYGGNVPGNKSTFIKEPWTYNKFIVLEDLRINGYSMLNRQTGLDVKHTLLAIEQLANLHALSWVYKKRNTLEYLVEKHPYFQDKLYMDKNMAGWRPVVEGFNASALEVIRKEFGEHSEIFLRLKALFSRDVIAILQMFLSGKGVNEVKAEALLRIVHEGPVPFNDPWLVATHGDCWINNLLFKYTEDDRKEPENIVIVDHQAFREACVTTDIAYLIYSSLQIPLRKQSVNVLLRTYFNKFVEICDALKQAPPANFTFDVFVRRWRRTRVYALLMSIMFISFIHKPPENEDNSASSQENNQSRNIGGTYSNVVIGIRSNDAWKNAIIETVQDEYNDGIL